MSGTAVPWGSGVPGRSAFLRMLQADDGGWWAMSEDQGGDDAVDGTHPSRRNFLKFVAAGAIVAPLVVNSGKAVAASGAPPYVGEVVAPPYAESAGSPWSFDGVEWTFARDKYVSETPIVCKNGWYPHYTSEAPSAWACEYKGMQITPTLLPEAARGVPYTSEALLVSSAGSSGGSTTTLEWHALEIPKGLRLSSSGVISGTPSTQLASGSYTVVASVTETVTTVSGGKTSKTKTTAQTTIPIVIV